MTIKWTGFVQGLWVDSFGNLREDRGGSGGGADGRHVYKDDNIIQTRLDPFTDDVKVDRFKDLNEDGLPDTATPYETVQLTRDAGDLGSWQKAGLAKSLKRVREISSPGSIRTMTAWCISDEQMAFSSANAATLAPYLRANATGDYTAANIISFLHGNQVTNMRDRQVLVNGSLHVWRLGDIVNSTPTIVGSPRERFDILYGDHGYATICTDGGKIADGGLCRGK